MTGGVADLMRRNLLNVFNEHDPDRRALANAEIYADDAGVARPGRGRPRAQDLESRAAELNGKAGHTFEVGDAARSATDRGPGRRPLADDR
jgi:hypothetical protein